MQALKDFRTSTGYSQDSIARKINVTVSYYSQIERGHVRAGMGFVQKFKAAFPEVSIDEIFFSDDKGVVKL